MFATYRLTPIDAKGKGLVLLGDEFVAPYKERYAEFVARGMRKSTSVLFPPAM